MFSKKIIIPIIILVTLLILGASYVIFIPDPVKSAEEYLKAVENNNYKKAYSLLAEESKEKISFKEMKNSYKDFYQKTAVEKKKIENLIVERNDFFSASADYRLKLNSSDFGQNKYNYNMKLQREGLINWKIVWNYNLIFPEMKRESEFVRKTVLPERGNIVDRNGKILAGQGHLVEVGLQAAKVEDEKLLIEKLTKIIDVNKSEIVNSLERYADKPTWFSPLINLTWEDYKKVEEKLRPISGVFFKKKEARVYPYKKAAAHLTGYISQISKNELENENKIDYKKEELTGKIGLEKSYQEKLRGENGYILYLTDKNNNRKEILNKKPVAGENLQTTIDAEIQKIAWKNLNNKKGAVVITDPKSGEILALVSSPSYDPNQFVVGLNQKEWRNISKNPNNPMLNRSIQGLYQPGSIFKIITAAAGLESELVETDTLFNDQGSIKVKGNVVKNYQNQVFGEHNFREAFTHSVNTTFAKIALEISKEKMLKYIDKFGFEKKITPGLIVKNSSIGTINDEVDLVWTALGQAKVVTTPIQMNKMISIVANKGENINLTLLKDEILKDNGNQIIKEKNINKIENMLINVIENGTGKNANIKGIKAAGKTGTAETGVSSKKPHAWFVGYLPVSDPKLAITVFRENGGVGGKDAAPIFKKIAEDVANNEK